MNKSNDGILDLSLQERIELAMDKTFRKLVEERRRSGEPLVARRNGRVVHLKPSPLPVEEWEEVEGANGSNDGK